MTASLAIRERIDRTGSELFESAGHKHHWRLVHAVAGEELDFSKTTIRKRFAFGPLSRGLLSIPGIISLFPVRAWKENLLTSDRGCLLRPRMQGTNLVPLDNRLVWKSDEA
jgi:hypothetical protein